MIDLRAIFAPRSKTSVARQDPGKLDLQQRGLLTPEGRDQLQGILVGHEPGGATSARVGSKKHFAFLVETLTLDAVDCLCRVLANWVCSSVACLPPRAMMTSSKESS